MGARSPVVSDQDDAAIDEVIDWPQGVQGTEERRVVVSALWVT